MKANLRINESKLQDKLATRVQIRFVDGSGYIKIDYYSLEEFEKLYETLVSS